MRRIAAGFLFAALLARSPAAAKDGPAPATPAAYPFTLGALKLTVVRGGGWQADNDGGVFGTKADQDEAAALLARAGQPTDVVHMDVDALLVRVPGHVVLIDAGLGPADHGVVQASLALVGVQPGDITDILITHHHTDHADGLVAADGGPAFPNAVVRLSTREWAAMQADKWSAATAKAIAPQVKTFEPGAELLPGITPVPLYGHTAGHVGYSIVSGDARLLDIGDLAHSVVISLARPGWPIDFDEDKPAGERMRRETLTRLARDHALVFAPHFPFPGIGHVTAAKDGGFIWSPVAH